MPLTKDQLRRIHGVAEPTRPADETVLARRKCHEAAATWLASRSRFLQAVFAAMGLVLVLLPVISQEAAKL